MRVLASGSIFSESGTVDLLGNFWFPSHLKKSQKVKFWSKKKVFFSTVNRLKNTSDCIKIDPPCPGQNLKKSQKKSKKWSKSLDDFFGFFGVWFFFAKQIFYKQKEVFSAGASPGAPLRGALGRAPLRGVWSALRIQWNMCTCVFQICSIPYGIF